MKRIVIIFAIFSVVFANHAKLNVVNNIEGSNFDILIDNSKILKINGYKKVSETVDVPTKVTIGIISLGRILYETKLRLENGSTNTFIINKNKDDDYNNQPILFSKILLRDDGEILLKDEIKESIVDLDETFAPNDGIKSSEMNSSNTKRLNDDSPSNNITRTQLHTVYAGGMYFNPSALNINAGDTVQFINEAGYHDVVVTVGPEMLSLGACSGPCNIGKLVFNTPGNYEYECSIGSHAAQGMVGSISVAEMQDVAKVQIVHNSPYPTVDIYVDGLEALGDVAYRTTTSLIELPTSTTVGIAPANDNIIASFPFTLQTDEHYIVTASGIVGDDNHPFGLVASSLDTSAVDENHFALKVFHGVTDAPAVDIYANGNILIENLSFNEYTEYAQVPVGDYVIDVTASGSTTPVASFSAPLTELGGGSGVVFASGFLSPASSDSSFALILTTPSGYSVQLPSTSTALSTINDYEISPLAFSLNQNYPNPFNPSTTISFDIYEASTVSLSIFDLNGRLVKNLMNGNLGAGTYKIDWNGKSTKGLSVAGGVYFYSINSGETSIIKKMSLIK